MNFSAIDAETDRQLEATLDRMWSDQLWRELEGQLPRISHGNVLVAEARDGYLPRKWAGILPEDTRIMALDPSGELLDEAREAFDERLQKRVFLVQQKVSSLSYAADVFAASCCFNGVVTARELYESVPELTRVTAKGGLVFVGVPLAASFSEFYDFLDEALRVQGLSDALERVSSLRDTFITPARLVDAAQQSGLEDISLKEISWRVSFPTGRGFLESPLIRETFFAHWMGAIRSSDREPILRYIGDAIDTYWHEREFSAEVTAGLFVGTSA